MGPKAPLREAEKELIRVEGEGYVEVEISIATTEMEGTGIADAQIRPEDVIGSRVFLIKEKASFAQNVEVYWKIEMADLPSVSPNGSYK